MNELQRVLHGICSHQVSLGLQTPAGRLHHWVAIPLWIWRPNQWLKLFLACSGISSKLQVSFFPDLDQQSISKANLTVWTSISNTKSLKEGIWEKLPRLAKHPSILGQAINVCRLAAWFSYNFVPNRLHQRKLWLLNPMCLCLHRRLQRRRPLSVQFGISPNMQTPALKHASASEDLWRRSWSCPDNVKSITWVGERSPQDSSNVFWQAWDIQTHGWCVDNALSPSLEYWTGLRVLESSSESTHSVLFVSPEVMHRNCSAWCIQYGSLFLGCSSTAGWKEHQNFFLHTRWGGMYNSVERTQITTACVLYPRVCCNAPWTQIFLPCGSTVGFEGRGGTALKRLPLPDAFSLLSICLAPISPFGLSET